MTRIIARLTTARMDAETRLAERLADRRGVSMLEYVMLAGIVIAVGALLAGPLRDAVGRLIDRIGELVTG